MYPSAFVWVVTVGGLLAVLVVDLALVPVGKHLTSLYTRAGFVALYAALSVLFGLAVWAMEPHFAGSFFAGWMSSYALSIDVIFVLLLITVGLGLSRGYTDVGVVLGICAALICCGVCIALGPVLVPRFDPVFYPAGAILIYAGFVLFRRGEHPGFPASRRRSGSGWVGGSETGHLGAAAAFSHSKPVIRLSFAAGAVVMTALVFAIHAVPPASAVTDQSYLIFCANAGALLGLRHLFFLIGGIIDRAIYAETGLGVMLAFVGLKLVLDAIDQRELARMPEMIWFTFTSVVVGLGATAITSRLTAQRLRSASATGASFIAAEDRERSAATGALADTADES